MTQNIWVITSQSSGDFNPRFVFFVAIQNDAFGQFVAGNWLAVNFPKKLEIIRIKILKFFYINYYIICI